MRRTRPSLAIHFDISRFKKQTSSEQYLYDRSPHYSSGLYIVYIRDDERPRNIFLYP